MEWRRQGGGGDMGISLGLISYTKGGGSGWGDEKGVHLPAPSTSLPIVTDSRAAGRTDRVKYGGSPLPKNILNHGSVMDHFKGESEC